ncbi:MAG: DUF1343 domain-containing protein [Rikenellaceae bacterium]|nr:DUF1343 domain-containing protein [Rikenellaceae bacterium]
MINKRIISLLAVIVAIIALFYAGTTIGQRSAPENGAVDIPHREVVPIVAHHPVPGAVTTESYLPLLEGKKVGIMCNHTALVGKIHLVDTLLASGVNVTVVFAPEHGFRGDADAGEHVKSYIDPTTGINVISAYGSTRKPDPKEIAGTDVMVFDIQDVGLRFYTYLSSMHYLMESCAEAGVPLIVLDRPNPNGMYVDGPILDPKHRSFIGMHPIPVVHGMTLGELARMINGEGWLADGLQCDLTVIPCADYTRSSYYELPVKPSPNLPNMRSVYLYPSICFFEATPVSLGRGTDFPFQVYGHPDMKGYDFEFTPRPREGAKDPLLNGRVCYGVDLRTAPSDSVVIACGIDLSYIIDAYNALGRSEKFFNNAFERLTGVDYVRRMIIGGSTAAEIKAVWAGDVEMFKRQRKPYLIYDE